MRALVRRTALLLAVGAVLFVFSERMFWSVWRPGDEVAAYFGGWLLYSFLGYALLALCSVFRVRDLAALFLAGALFGWLDEGVVAMTLFGDASFPFPLTVSWTGLAWHALLTTMLGFYALRRCLQAPAIWPTAGLSAALGVFWGVWALGWHAETPRVSVTGAAFFSHVLGATAALAVAHLALWPAGLADFRPSRAGMLITAAAIALFTALITVPAVGLAALALIPLFAGSLLVLRRQRGRRGGPDMLQQLGGPIRLANLAGLAVLPAAATMAYLTLNPGLFASVHLVVAALTTLLGFAALAIALTAMLAGWPRLAVRELG